MPEKAKGQTDLPTGLRPVDKSKAKATATPPHCVPPVRGARKGGASEWKTTSGTARAQPRNNQRSRHSGHPFQQSYTILPYRQRGRGADAQSALGEGAQPLHGEGDGARPKAEDGRGAAPRPGSYTHGPTGPEFMGAKRPRGEAPIDIEATNLKKPVNPHG